MVISGTTLLRSFPPHNPIIIRGWNQCELMKQIIEEKIYASESPIKPDCINVSKASRETIDLLSNEWQPTQQQVQQYLPSQKVVRIRRLNQDESES